MVRLISVVLAGLGWLGLVPGATAPADESATVREAVVRDASGKERAALVVSPRGREPIGGVLFVHWLGPPPHNDRTEFLPDARALARTGIVSLLVDEPWADAQWFPKHKLEEDPAFSEAELSSLRSEIDLLHESLPEKAAARIALVGHDFGAMYGALLAGSDSRIGAAVFIAGIPHFADWFLLGQHPTESEKHAYLEKMTPFDVEKHLKKRSRLPSLFQFARKDKFVSEAQARTFFEASPGPKEIRWYDADHDLQDAAATKDRIAWLTSWFTGPTDSGSETAQDLMRIERELAQASLHLDPAPYDLYWADEFVGMDETGRSTYTKPQHRAVLTSGAIRFESLEVDELNVQVLGETALVVCRRTVRFRYNDQEQNMQNRVLSVFAHRGTGWQKVAEYTHRIAAAPPAPSPVRESDAPATPPHS